ncbi:MAG: hypothetical protein QOF77_655 [Solirubrobacteraceae bacterium]|nr:hypothetical protein [Solirubrobacteraceae bacterium]
MSLLRASLLASVTVIAAVLAAVLLAPRIAATPAAARTASPAMIGQARADALAAVARRIYFEEVFGSPNSSAFRRIAALPGLATGLETGNLVLARRTLNHVILRHVVHERVVRGSRTVVDVGLKFVVGGQRRPLHAPDGTYLGRLEVSIQDVIGYVKLFHRLTGAEIVVRGGKGHAKSSLPAFGRALPPANGPVTVGGRTYFVSSFTRLGFAGEPLRIFVLASPSG